MIKSWQGKVGPIVSSRFEKKEHAQAWVDATSRVVFSRGTKVEGEIKPSLLDPDIPAESVQRFN